MSGHNVPNLDAMPRSELLEFWQHYRQAHDHTDRARYLTGLEWVAAVSAAETLAAYALAKACAMRLRLEGKIPEAQSYEQHCDCYYSELPKQLRW